MSFARYPAYKDSGVEWLGKVPGHWEVKRLKYNLQLLTEKTNRREHAIALENIESWTGRYLPTETEFEGDGVAFEAGDILFGKLRPYLAKAYLAESSGEAVGDFHVLRPTINTHGRFAQYQVLNREFIDLVDGSTFGSKMPRASWEFVAGIALTSPPKAEQQAIATFLDIETAKIDGLIAEQQALVALLKEKRQAVISHAVTKGLNPAAPMKDSGVAWLGEVPGHWEVKKLANLSSQIQTGPFGSQLHSDEYIDDGTPVINPSNIQAGKINADWSCTVDAQVVERLARHKLELGDIVFARRGEMGRCAMVTENSVDWLCGTGSLNVRLMPNVFPEFVATYLGTMYVKELLQLESVGSTMDNLNTQILGAVPVPTPPAEEQKSIIDYLNHQTSQLDTLTQEAQTAIALLQERRTALISAAVTGKMDVRAAVAA